jgi:hypothetical protein
MEAQRHGSDSFLEVQNVVGDSKNVKLLKRETKSLKRDGYGLAVMSQNIQISANI